MKKRTPNRRAPACPRVPVCMLDEARAGIPLNVRQEKQKFAIIGLDEARPLALRKREKDAKALVEVTLQELAREAAQMTPQEAERRRHTRLITPQKPNGEPAEYQVIEAARLVPSHLPTNFQPDPRYPVGVQEREYDRDQHEQRKVVSGAQHLDPAFLLTDTPTATDGPPIVTAGPDMLVLGGNGRSMMILRAYREGLARADEYREALLSRVSDFGISRAHVETIAHPVLVRVVEDLRSDAPKSELVSAVRRYNEDLKQALSPKAKAIAEARVLSPGTIEALGELLAGSGDASLREVLKESPRAVVEILERDGVITPQNKSAWIQGNELIPEAKDRIEGMFLGRVIGTGDRYAQTAPSILAKVERAAPWLIRVQGANPASDEIPRVQAALDLLNDAAVHGMTVADVVRQESLFGTGPVKQDDVAELARLFETAGPRTIGERFKRWGRVAGVDPRQGSLLGAPPSREEAFALLLEAGNTDLEKARRRNPSNPTPILIESRAPSSAALAQDMRRQLGGVPLRGYFLVDRAPWAVRPMVVIMEDGKVTRFFHDGKNKARLAAELTDALQELERKPNPGGKGRASIDPLTQSLALALVAKWKAAAKGDALEQRRLENRAKDLERGVRALGNQSLAQAFKLANTIARRTGVHR